MLYFSIEQKHIITQCNYNYSPEGIYHPDRVMKEYDFLLLINGSWEIVEEDQTYLLHEGDLLILEPGLHHFSRKRCSPEMRNMYLHCAPLPADGNSVGNVIGVSKQTDSRCAPEISRLFRNIIEEYWNRHDQYSNQRIGNLFELLLMELAVCGQKNQIADPVISEVLQFFLENNDKFFKTDEISAHFGINAHSLNLRFKKVTGTTLYQYQLTQKLNMIHEVLIENPSRGLRDIALSFGFYDEFQFSKLYKRQFGYPPSCRRKGSRIDNDPTIVRGGQSGCEAGEIPT